MTFLVVALNTQAKTAKLTTPALNSPRPAKFPQKFHVLLCLGVHFQLTRINYAPKCFSAPGGARAPSAHPAGYAYGHC